MNIVLDTSVLVAAARSRNGASHRLLSGMPNDRFTTVISVPLFVEYQDVLLQPENLLDRTPRQAEGFLNFLLSISHLQEVFYQWRPALSDPDDDMVLEVAGAGNCRYIVTHNRRDFRGSESWGVTAIKPSDFIKLIENQYDQRDDSDA